MSAGDVDAQTRAYEKAIESEGGIGHERHCKNCGFANDSGANRSTCEKCGEPLPMKRNMTQEEKAQYEGLLVELIMQGQQYAQHVWGGYTSNCGDWRSYEPNPCLLNGCPSGSKFLNGLRELCGTGGDSLAGPKTEFIPCPRCSGKKEQGCDDCLGTGTYPKVTWGKLEGKWCWHGTGSDNVYCLIAHDSLRPDLRSGQVHGPGEYFGVNPSISQPYARGTNRQLVCFTFTGVKTSGDPVSGMETKHAKGRSDRLLSAFFNYAAGFCYVVNNPGGNGCLQGREHDKGVMYCLPVGLVSYGDVKPFSWSGLKCGAAILGAKSSWDLPEFTERLEVARRAQVKAQREEQLMWMYMYHEKNWRENIIVENFNSLFAKWCSTQDSEAAQAFKIRAALDREWEALCAGPEAQAVTKSILKQKAIEDQKGRADLEKKLARVLQQLLKRLAKDPHKDVREATQHEVATQWIVQFVGPRASPFQDFPLKAVVEFPLKFPAAPPTVRFDCALYHPNVDSRGAMFPRISKGSNWTQELGEKIAPDKALRLFFSEVANTLFEPDMMNRCRGTIAEEVEVTHEGFLKWRAAAAEHHETAGAMEDLSAVSGARDVEAVGRPRSASTTKETRPGRKAGALTSHADFVQIMSECSDETEGELQLKRRRLLGDKQVGDPGEYKALVSLTEDFLEKGKREMAEHRDEFRVAFDGHLRDFMSWPLPVREVVPAAAAEEAAPAATD